MTPKELLHRKIVNLKANLHMDTGEMVKLDMCVEPWEVVGRVVSHGTKKFRIEVDGTVLVMYIKDILHYRVE